MPDGRNPYRVEGDGKIPSKFADGEAYKGAKNGPFANGPLKSKYSDWEERNAYGEKMPRFVNDVDLRKVRKDRVVRLPERVWE